MYAIFTYCMLSMSGQAEGCVVHVEEIPYRVDCEREAQIRMDMVIARTPEINRTGQNYLCIGQKSMANSIALGMGKRLNESGRITQVETLK